VFCPLMIVDDRNRGERRQKRTVQVAAGRSYTLRPRGLLLPAPIALHLSHVRSCRIQLLHVCMMAVVLGRTLLRHLCHLLWPVDSTLLTDASSLALSVTVCSRCTSVRCQSIAFVLH